MVSRVLSAVLLCAVSLATTAEENPAQLNLKLFEAVGLGHSEDVGALLAQGASPHARNRFGNTPLMIAAGKGHVDLVELFLHGAGRRGP